VRLAQAYFDVLAAQDALASVRALKTAVSQQLAAAQRNFEVGNATITDSREAQARFDLASAQEIAARTTCASRPWRWSSWWARPASTRWRWPSPSCCRRPSRPT
jgi:outer membrane protein